MRTLSASNATVPRTASPASGRRSSLITRDDAACAERPICKCDNPFRGIHTCLICGGLMSTERQAR